MRYKFAESLEQAMELNPNVYFITADLGYKIFDKLLSKFPTRAFNIGASEQLMLSMAIGLADSNKIPFVYSITPFLLYRPFELLRTYLNHENTNVKLIGSGRDGDYEHDGFTHFAGDDKQHLSCLKNIKGFWPENKEEINLVVNQMLEINGPCYLNLKR
jgi:transketolase